MAEVHIIGQIAQAKDFPNTNLFCKWYLQIGNNWKIIAGKGEGQTQVSCSQFDNTSTWSFPIDIHLATAGVQGWPKIYLQVYHLDWLGRSHIFGYGLITIPTTPGTHTLDCYTWRPFGSIKDRFVQYFLGGGFQIKNPDLIFSSGDRYKLSTEAMGVVSFELTVILRFLLIAFLVGVQCLEQTSVKPSTQTATTLKSLNTTLSSSTDISTTTPLATTMSSLSNVTTSTTSAPTTIPSKTRKKDVSKTETKRKIMQGKSLCPCNLRLGYCDINCCCDLDCSLEDKLVFDHCEPDFHYYDKRFCSYVKNEYFNFTLMEHQINQNGLFCILHSNMPPNYVLQKKHPLKSFEEAKFQQKDKFSWPENQVELNLANFDGKNYVFGAQIWIISTEKNNKNVTIKKLEYSKPFFGSKCIMQEPVNYLINIESNCKIDQLDENNVNLKVESYMNMSIIAQPHLFNASLLEKSSLNKTCKGRICLTPTTYICPEEIDENCILHKASMSTMTKIRCFSNSTTSKTCWNVVEKIHYEFEHNGTNGITKFKLKLVLKNVTWPLQHDSVPIFRQLFSVNFNWASNCSSLNYSSYLSGNPGYLIGKPILTANLISDVVFDVKNQTNSTNNKNLTSAISVKVFRNATDFISNFFVIFKSDNNGKCILNSNVYTPVEFGYNLYSKCNLIESMQVKIDAKNQSMNATTICRQIQSKIFQYWSINNLANQTLENKLIGQFGNANASKRADWSNVLFREDLKAILSNVGGMFDSVRKCVICHNITNVLKIDCFHARIDFEDGILNQEKILATTFEFFKLNQIELQFNPEGSKMLKYQIKLKVQIGFHDITTSKIRKIVDPPTLNIKLPHDFFYPFVKLSNGGNGVINNYSSLVLGLIVISKIL